MTSAEQADSRLAPFRDVLHAGGARRAFDLLLARVQTAGSWRFLAVDLAADPADHRAADGPPPLEIRCVHELTGEQAFSLRASAGHLILGVDSSGVARVPGGLPALEAGLGEAGDSEGGLWSLPLARPAQVEALVQLLFEGEGHAVNAFRSRHWRLNVTRAGAAQVEGGYVWASKKPAARSGQPVRSGITRILPGDLLFARAGSHLMAIGVALERARSSPDPALTSTDGWLVPVRFERLAETAALPGSGSAVARNRPRSPVPKDAQLFEIPEDEAQAIRRTLGRQVETFEERVRWQTSGMLVEQAMEEQIWLRTDIAPLDKQHLSAARQGGGRFRDNVERFEPGCRVTGVLDRRYLRATHIKPWRDATDAERLDGANGLLLSPHLLQLFARGHISFADDGSLLLSRYLNPYVRKSWYSDAVPAPCAFRGEQCVYLDYHRTRLFERVEGGRRLTAGDSQEPT